MVIVRARFAKNILNVHTYPSTYLRSRVLRSSSFGKITSNSSHVLMRDSNVTFLFKYVDLLRKIWSVCKIEGTETLFYVLLFRFLHVC